MASTVWRSSRALGDLLFERYGSFDVFQLQRLLQWEDRRHAGRATQRDAPERQIRFRADLSAAFPGREITRLQRYTPPPGEDSGMPLQRQPGHEVVEISTANFCVASALGPLPEPYLEWMRDLQRMREHAMVRFLDLFNQRIHALRYDLKASQTAGLNNAQPENTPHAFYLSCLMGLGLPELAANVPLPPRAWLGLAGLLANRRRSASTVRQVLALFLSAKVTVEQRVGAWHDIEEEDRIALGRSNNRLGTSSTLGRRVWDQQSRIRVLVAPMPFERFVSLLPPERGGTESLHFGRFVALLRLLLDRFCDCEVRLQVDWDSVPGAVLTAAPDDGQRGLRLGQTAWLKQRPGAAPAPAVGYLVHAYEAMDEWRQAA